MRQMGFIAFTVPTSVIAFTDGGSLILSPCSRVCTVGALVVGAR